MRPDKIGPYRVLETVAEDPFTITFRVSDSALNRELRLKTARGAPHGLKTNERLSREAKLVGAFSHDGLLRLFGLVKKDDSVFLLFENIEGPSLLELLRKTKRLLVPRALALTAQVAKAVSYLHERGLVHGGLRPEKIVLSKHGRAVITDFGTLHPAGAPDPDEAPIAPEYLAPEQILSETTEPRADVFSLGILLYEMLAGERPWNEPAPRAPNPDVLAAAPPPEARHVLAHRIRSAAPPALTTSEGDPPESVARIVSRCLAKDPADRYPNAKALAEDLTDALREISVESEETLVIRALAAGDFVPDLPPKNPRVHTELFPVRNVPKRLAGELLAVLGLVLLGAFVTEQARGERPAAPPSETTKGERGYLRVLADPWAEVIVDGEPIDTTPIGRPIAVAPGRHFVTFHHPNAVDEKRTVDVRAGQTVLLDVVMKVERATPDAGVEAGSSDDSP